MKMGELFKKLARAEHIDEESINKLRLFNNVKGCFSKLGETIRQLKPSEWNTLLYYYYYLYLNCAYPVFGGFYIFVIFEFSWEQL